MATDNEQESSAPWKETLNRVYEMIGTHKKQVTKFWDVVYTQTGAQNCNIIKALFKNELPLTVEQFESLGKYGCYLRTDTQNVFHQLDERQKKEYLYLRRLGYFCFQMQKGEIDEKAVFCFNWDIDATLLEHALTAELHNDITHKQPAPLPQEYYPPAPIYNVNCPPIPPILAPALIPVPQWQYPFPFNAGPYGNFQPNPPFCYQPMPAVANYGPLANQPSLEQNQSGEIKTVCAGAEPNTTAGNTVHNDGTENHQNSATVHEMVQNGNQSSSGKGPQQVENDGSVYFDCQTIDTAKPKTEVAAITKTAETSNLGTDGSVYFDCQTIDTAKSNSDTEESDYFDCETIDFEKSETEVAAIAEIAEKSDLATKSLNAAEKEMIAAVKRRALDFYNQSIKKQEQQAGSRNSLEKAMMPEINATTTSIHQTENEWIVPKKTATGALKLPTMAINDGDKKKNKRQRRKNGQAHADSTGPSSDN